MDEERGLAEMLSAVCEENTKRNIITLLQECKNLEKAIAKSLINE